MGDEERSGEARQRIDKWLFFARIVKSRAIAQAHIASGHVKINGTAIRQASRQVGPGDRVEISLERGDLVLVVCRAGERRGPYPEARLLYDNLTPPPIETDRVGALEQALRKPGAGRPTKRERRLLDALRPRDAGESD